MRLEPDPEVGRIAGVVLDRAGGKPLAYAELYFGSDTENGYPADDGGHYSGLLSAGTHRATIVYTTDDGETMWMRSAPFEVAANKLTRQDFAFAPEPCPARRGDADVDHVFTQALVERFSEVRDPRIRIVHARQRSRGNSVSMGGIDLTTEELLQEESDRSHKTISYWHVDARLENGCTARVTIGESCVSPHRSAFDCDEGWFWLYGKDASGWHRLASLGGYATWTRSG